MRKYFFVILSAIAGVVLGFGVAYAASGPPVNQGTQINGPEYQPGDILYLCVNRTTEALRAEIHSDRQGNCAANEIQIPLVVPNPYPTPVSSPAPSATVSAGGSPEALSARVVADPSPSASQTAAPLISCPVDEVCGVAGLNGNGNAMNDWFGNTGKVYSYTQGKSNENFGGEFIDRCNGGHLVTATCPFVDHSKDVALSGHVIIQEVDAGGTNAGTCVGSDSGEVNAALVTCNNPTTGTGGGLYSVFVVAGNDSFVSLGCTNNSGAWCQLNQNVNAQQDFFQTTGNGPTVWAPIP